VPNDTARPAVVRNTVGEFVKPELDTCQEIYMMHSDDVRPELHGRERRIELGGNERFEIEGQTWI